MNQLFRWIYDDFEEVEIQSQNYSIKVVPKKKPNTHSIQTMEFFVSYILTVDMEYISILNIPKFVQYLKSLNDLSSLHQQDGLEGASSEHQIGVEISDEKLITKPIKEYLFKTKFADSENIALQNHVFRQREFLEKLRFV